MNLFLRQKKNNSSFSYRYGFLIFVFFLYFISSFMQAHISNLGLDSRYFAILLLFVGLFYSSNIKSFSIKNNLIFIYIWMFFKFFSLLWGYSNIYGIQVVEAHFFTHLLMFLLLVVISNININNDWYVKILSAYYLSSIIMVILQIFFHKPFEGIEVRQVVTLFNGQDDPNQLGAILNVSFCFSLYYSFIKRKFVNLLFMVLSVYAIVLTASRGALITMIAIVFAFTVYFISTSNISYSKKVYIIVLILILIAIIARTLLKYVPQDIFDRLFVDEYGTGSGRLDFWQDSIKLFVERPIFGYGWGGYFVRAHNTYLSMVLDVGLAGLFLFLFYFARILFLNIKKGNTIVVFLLIASFVSSMFIEAITLRFLWNSFIFATMALNIKEDM